MLDVPEELIEDRHRLGLDKRDEVWGGVLHMVPPPAPRHNFFAGDLLFALARIVAKHRLRATYEVGVFDPVQGLRDFRVPDLVVAPQGLFSDRGVEGHATLVVEVLSPNDESRDKIPFYARVGVREVWLIDPVTRAIEIYHLRDAELVSVRPHGGVLHSDSLELDLETIPGPKLQLRDGTDTYEI
jgi:Uma2 family endonuclease